MTTTAPPATDVPVRSVKKALDLLNVLLFDDLAREGRTLGDLARELGLKSSTCHNLLKTLAACQYVEQTPDGRYAAGPVCRRIGTRNALFDRETRAQIERLMVELNAELREGVVFAVLVDGRRLTASHVECDQRITVNSMGMHVGCPYQLPTGRVLLAHAGAEEVARVVERHGLPGSRWNGIRSMRALDRACARVRETIENEGVYRMPEEIEADSDTADFAVPCLTAADGLIGAVGCHAPAYRVDAAVAKRIAECLRLTADRIAKTV